MPDYTVVVTKSKVVQEDIPITAADEATAEANAITYAKTYTFEDKLGSYEYTAEATLVP